MTELDRSTATGQASVAGSPAALVPPSRTIRDTSLYTASLGLFGVLVGLALFTPLNNLAADVLDNPLGGNWAGRALAIGLLIEVGFQLHQLASVMGTKTLLGGSMASRHPTLPGVRWFKGYHTALSDMWLGAVTVFFLIVLAAAIPRGVAVFLAVFVVYCAWTELWYAIYLLRNRAWARQTWRAARNPLALMRQLDADRFVPATLADLEALNGGDDPSVEGMLFGIVWFFGVWLLPLLFAVSALLWLIASAMPALAMLVSVVWLAANTTVVVLSYRYQPQVFTA